MRATTLALLVLLSLGCWGLPAAAASAGDGSEDVPTSVSELAERRWGELETAEVLAFIRDLQARSAPGTVPIGIDAIRSIVRGEGLPLSAADILGTVARVVFGALTDNVALLGRLVLLAVLVAVLQLLQGAFERDTIATAAHAAVYMAMAAVGLVAFHQAVGLAQGVVDDLVDFMLAMLPLMVTLLAGVGAFVTAGVVSPLSVMMVNGVGMIAARWVLPLILLGTVLEVVHHLPGRIQIGRLASLVRQVGMVSFSLTLVIFLGVMAVQGAAAGVADGVLLRTAKFGAGTFIPVLGGMFADATELVISSSLLLKNAVGLFGLVVVIMLAGLPLLKVLTLVFVFRLAAAVVQPVADGPFVQALSAMSDGLVLAGLVAAAVALMFFLALTVVLGVGNVTVMMR